MATGRAQAQRSAPGLAWVAAPDPAAAPRSLSELREYTEGLGEPAEAEACTPAPGPSVLSLLSAEELRRFIEEVKELDAATLKVGCSRLGRSLGGHSASPLRPRGGR